MHPLISQQITERILPNAFRVEGTGVPYSALMSIADEERRAEFEGIAIFHIGEDKLIVEFFVTGTSGDNWPGLERGVGLLYDSDMVDIRLVLTESGVEIPVDRVKTNSRTNTYRTGVPHTIGYEVEVSGWVGDENSTLESAVVTFSNLPTTLYLPYRQHWPLNMVNADFKPQDSLNMHTPEWRVQLSDSSEQPRRGCAYAIIEKPDDVPFAASEISGIIEALRLFLSFQGGYWVSTPTVVGFPYESPEHADRMRAYGEAVSALFHQMDRDKTKLSDEQSQILADPPEAILKSRMYVGRLAPVDAPGRQGTSAEMECWPDLFHEFMTLFESEDRDHLVHCVQRYITCSRAIHLDLDLAHLASSSAFEAAVRWWVGQKLSSKVDSVTRWAEQAIENAQLGADDSMQLDLTEFRRILKNMQIPYRNNAAHGSPYPPNIGLGNETSAALCFYFHHMVRLLILAKLGLRKARERSFGYSHKPRFV